MEDTEIVLIIAPLMMFLFALVSIFLYVFMWVTRRSSDPPETRVSVDGTHRFTESVELKWNGRRVRAMPLPLAHFVNAVGGLSIAGALVLVRDIGIETEWVFTQAFLAPMGLILFSFVLISWGVWKAWFPPSAIPILTLSTPDALNRLERELAAGLHDRMLVLSPALRGGKFVVYTCGDTPSLGFMPHFEEWDKELRKSVAEIAGRCDGTPVEFPEEDPDKSETASTHGDHYAFQDGAGLVALVSEIVENVLPSDTMTITEYDREPESDPPTPVSPSSDADDIDEAESPATEE